MTSDDFELDRVMQMVADRALEVCQASGVAIALLGAGRNELVYKAGSGNAANDVGRRVPAVMSGSSPQESRREILRVENAETDKRIEAEICRQFGATALLMLPICTAHMLSGVLQVLFDSAHSFGESEVRTYRLMATALEEAILRSAQRQRAASPVEKISHPLGRDQCQPPEDTAGASGRFADAGQPCVSAILTGDPEVVQPEVRTSHDPPAIVVRELSALRSAFTRAIATMEARAGSANSRYAGPAIAAAVVLTIVVLISQLHHAPHANIGSSFSRSQHAQRQARANAGFAAQSETVPGDEPKKTAVSVPGFKRIRVGPKEVDYIADDVTIRTFESRPAEPQIRRSGQNEITFGEDVTVRYFARTPAFVSGHPRGPEAERIANQSSQ